MNINEQIDALCNGELTTSEQEELIRRLKNTPELIKDIGNQLRVHQTLSVVMGDDSSNNRVIKAVLVSLASNKSIKQCISGGAGELRNSPNKKIRMNKQGKRAKQPIRRRGGTLRFIMSMAASIALLAGTVFFFMKDSLFPKQPVIARLVSADSEISIRRAGEEIPARPGMSIKHGDVLLSQSRLKAKILFNDETIVNVDGKTRVVFRKRSDNIEILELDYGHISAMVHHQPAGCSMLFKTPDATAKILGTVFDLSADEAETKLTVSHGIVEITANGNGKSVVVTRGLCAIVSKSGDIKLAHKGFVLGVNLNGGPVTIDGNPWQSEAMAVKNGLSFSDNVKTYVGNTTVVPAMDSDTSAMLNTVRWAKISPWRLRQKIANGEYVVYIWTMENATSNFRSIDIEVNGMTVGKAVGELEKSHWAKYGPYPAHVTDGEIEMKLIPHRGDAHLMGFAIFNKQAKSSKRLNE